MLTQQFSSVHSAAAYWNLMAEATNPVRRNRIGPLKEGGWKPCLEKANLINDFFANIGTRLGRANRNFLQQSDRIGCSVPSVTDITVYEDSVRRKLKALKPNKGLSSQEIMEMAKWKKESTFRRHYLRKIDYKKGQDSFQVTVLQGNRR